MSDFGRFRLTETLVIQLNSINGESINTENLIKIQNDISRERIFLDIVQKFNRFLPDFEWFLPKTENFTKNLLFWSNILVAILNFFHAFLASKLEKVGFRVSVIFFEHILLDFEFIVAKNDENRQFSSLLWLADPDRTNLH